ESLWQTPQASTLIGTWPASGCGTSRSTSSSLTWLADLLPSQLGHSSSLTVDYQGQTLDSEGMPQGILHGFSLPEPTAFAKAGIICRSADLWCAGSSTSIGRRSPSATSDTSRIWPMRGQ